MSGEELAALKREREKDAYTHGELQGRLAERSKELHRTCPVPLPRHQCRWNLTVGVLTSGPASMSGGAPDMHCRVSGAPAPACLTTARFCRALNAPAGDRWREVAVAPLAHRTDRCAPDLSGEL